MTPFTALALCCAVPTFGFVRMLALHADTPQLRRRRIIALENINRSAPDTRLQRSEARTGLRAASPAAPVRARSHRGAA